MVQINFAQKTVSVKIVYYGPGMSGKTTNLEVVHQRAPDSNRGDLTSIATDGDRTLFFDFMPLDLGTVAGMRTQFQIYTVPGQVYYNSTRKLVLQGVDGVIFVADSSASMVEENLESLRNLQENLAEYGKDLSSVPYVIQYNKRDLPDALPVEELEQRLNPAGVPSYEAVASSGQGVFPTLKALAAVVLDSIHKNQGAGAAGATEQPAAPVAPAAPTAVTETTPSPAPQFSEQPVAPSSPVTPPAPATPEPQPQAVVPTPQVEPPAPALPTAHEEQQCEPQPAEPVYQEASASQETVVGEQQEDQGLPTAQGVVPPASATGFYQQSQVPQQPPAAQGLGDSELPGDPAGLQLQARRPQGTTQPFADPPGFPAAGQQQSPAAPTGGPAAAPAAGAPAQRPAAPQAPQAPAPLSSTGFHQRGGGAQGFPQAAGSSSLESTNLRMRPSLPAEVQGGAPAPGGVSAPGPVASRSVPAPSAQGSSAAGAAGGRLKPRAQQARPTPRRAGQRRSVALTGVFVVAALVAGAALGGFVFNLF